MNEPLAERPHMPGYGIADLDDGILPWSWAVELIDRVRNHTIVTVRADGRPHAMPCGGCGSMTATGCPRRSRR